MWNHHYRLLLLEPMQARNWFRCHLLHHRWHIKDRFHCVATAMIRRQQQILDRLLRLLLKEFLQVLLQYYFSN
jgi:hypothetical protein